MTANGLGALFGKKWEFVAAQAWDRSSPAGQPQFPHDELPDEAYQAIEGAGPRYEISFSPDGGTVRIKRTDDEWRCATEPTVAGGRERDSETELHYSLEDGLFAGGRLVVKMDDHALRGELTIYGSGRPIIASERGTFSSE